MQQRQAENSGEGFFRSLDASTYVQIGLGLNCALLVAVLQESLKPCSRQRGENSEGTVRGGKRNVTTANSIATAGRQAAKLKVAEAMKSSSGCIRDGR